VGWDGEVSGGGDRGAADSDSEERRTGGDWAAQI
jgi:hypothetical protein